ncbi:hypothetical protein KP509_11G030900 [Ceratopteris richardii]|uniref:Agglutinin domain-containing protein n=1 Tax=Ceratopteris richardii TaxID=49495 RepID=A0A8T2TWP1_CERRI|nr:hypothetical protein KP509_11G030900 [Ceratopteris richardii]
MASSVADPVSVLPRYIAIKGDNGMYLALKSDGLLTFDSAEMTRLATHEVLYNVNDPNATFIVRSMNMHFWRRDPANWIRADRSDAPSASDKSGRFTLARLESGKLAFRSAVDGRYLNRYILGLHGYNAVEETRNQWSEVEVSDAWEHAVSLPRYIFLKGDNDRYLHTYYERGLNWLKFHGTDPGNLYGTSEVFPLLDGSIALYSTQTDRFWGNGGNWMPFEPIKLSRSIMALRNQHNNLICNRLSEYWISSLNASASSTSDITTRLTLSEAAGGRQVFDVKYLLNLASTDDQKPLAVAYDMVVVVTISQKVSTSYPFSNSFTFSQSVTTAFKAGIPFLAEGKVEVEIGLEQSFSNEWGETTEKGIEFQTQFVVKDVPPGGTASVTVVYSTAKMRIPFTYKSKESAPDGIDRPTQEFVDGMFEGVDAYKIEVVISDSVRSYATPVKRLT